MFVDYKYGPFTTRRRSLALKKRKELLESGSLVKAHVAYRKIPNISPGHIEVRKHFLGGLHLGGLIFGWEA